MADNDQDNDEYQFTELDSLENESIGDPDFSTDTMPPPPLSTPERVSEPTNVKRNVLILLGALASLMLMYKFIGGMLSRKSVPIQSSIQQSAPEVVVSAEPKKSIIPPEPIATEPAPQPAVQESNSVVPQKIAAIEASQQTVQTEVNAMTQQVGNVNNNINSLNEQITKMNQMLNELTVQMVRQNEELNVLRQRVQSKLVRRRTHHRNVHQPVYYINAVIPGRAWLIGSNGSTLTVKEGTKIAGYGVVRLIDSLQGKILTSSGRIIKFDQE